LFFFFDGGDGTFRRSADLLRRRAAYRGVAGVCIVG